MNSIVRLDTRGRLVIPNEYRETLNLKEGDEVLISLDNKTDTLLISPIYGKPKDLVKMEIEFGDTPGCLAKIAERLALLKIDLILTESRSSQRGKRARWDVIADISRCKKTIPQIKQYLTQSGYIESVLLVRIRQSDFHR